MRLFQTLLATGAFFLLIGCQSGVMSSQPKRDINKVLAANTDKLMFMPSVVGVYVGLMPDQRTQCIKVMLNRNDLETIKQIPTSLEGHPVRVEIAGEIKPYR